MTHRVVMPNGNSHTSFVAQSVRLVPNKGVAVMDARGKLLEWIPVTDAEKAQRVQHILHRGFDGDRRYRNPDWTFLQEAPKAAVVEAQGKDSKQESKK